MVSSACGFELRYRLCERVQVLGTVSLCAHGANVLKPQPCPGCSGGITPVKCDSACSVAAPLPPRGFSTARLLLLQAALSRRLDASIDELTSARGSSLAKVHHVACAVIIMCLCECLRPHRMMATPLLSANGHVWVASRPSASLSTSVATWVVRKV